MAQPKPTPGRIVHYVVPGGPTAGEHRAAIVVDDQARPDGRGDWELDLHVWFRPQDEPGLPSLDVYEDAAYARKRRELSTYVQHAQADNSGAANPGSWHWPEREDKGMG